MVKLGPKQKHLEVPAGWKLVTQGLILSNDQFANVGNPNAPFWQPVDSEDIGDPVIWYDAIIRKE